jgi:hypothetical protein
MERELGISYPTVRSRVEALVRALGFGARADAAAGDTSEDDTEVAPAPRTRDSILERLARREISAEDAAMAIRELGKESR